jgi:hypothetical protein
VLFVFSVEMEEAKVFASVRNRKTEVIFIAIKITESG